MDSRYLSNSKIHTPSGQSVTTYRRHTAHQAVHRAAHSGFTRSCCAPIKLNMPCDSIAKFVVRLSSTKCLPERYRKGSRFEFCPPHIAPMVAIEHRCVPFVARARTLAQHYSRRADLWASGLEVSVERTAAGSERLAGCACACTPVDHPSGCCNASARATQRGGARPCRCARHSGNYDAAPAVRADRGAHAQPDATGRNPIT